MLKLESQRRGSMQELYLHIAVFPHHFSEERGRLKRKEKISSYEKLPEIDNTELAN